MRRIAIPRSPLRNLVLGLAAVALALLPDGVFAGLAGAAWEVTVLRMLGLVGVSLLAGLPWLRRASLDAQRRLRWWSVPGLAATAIYLLSTDPVYLLVGFCLLTGAAVDMWMARAHIASETLRVRLMARERFDR